MTIINRKNIFIFLLFLILPAGLSAPSAAQSAKKMPNTVPSISYSRTDHQETVIISLQREISYRARFLDHNPQKNLPYRLFVDLFNTRLSSGLSKSPLPENSCITRIRTAQRNSTTARIVLDIRKKIFREDYRITQSSHPPLIKIEFFHAPTEKPADKTSAKETGQPSPEIVSTDSYEEKPPDKDPNLCVVVIDPGHGGKDPGAIGYRGLQEKDVCLPLAIQLQKFINSKKGYKAVLTRDKDIFLSLDERGAIANKYNADIFVSLHTNSHEDSRLTGIETYYLSFASDEAARKVAARENFTTAAEISDLEMIFFDLLQNNKINQSSILAGYVHNAMVDKLANGYGKKVRNLGIKHAPMRVLINTEMPCILIETAFISNPKEAKQLKSTAFQKTLAASIFNGIDNFRSAQKTAFNTASP